MLSADLIEPTLCESPVDLDAELKACAIADRLTEQIHDASVQYECSDGVYEFAVRYGESSFRFWFPEEGLLRKRMQELEQMTAQIVDRIRASRVDTAGQRASSTQE